MKRLALRSPVGASLLATSERRSREQARSHNCFRVQRAFTLLELLAVAGLIATLSFLLVGGLAGSGKAGTLRSAQARLANLVMAARTKAVASGQSARVLIHVDASSASQPLRFLRYAVIQTQTAGGWQTVSDTFLPEGAYILPGNFSSMAAGLFAPDPPVPWTKADGSALRSTALRSNQITFEAINGPDAELWVSFTISANAGTAQSGDIILASGRRRMPGSYQPGESPVELTNPEEVRGLTLSSYAVPALINARASF